MARILGGIAAGSVDALFRRGVLQHPPSPRDPDELAADIESFTAAHYEPRLLSEPQRFFIPPGAVDVHEVPRRRPVVRSLGGTIRCVDLRWRSEHGPFFFEAVRARYQAAERNTRGTARLFTHRDGPRPTAILIHGYLGGMFGVEERMWPIRWLLRQGLDVAISVLPFHGHRGSAGRFETPAWPNADMRVTAEGYRQAVWDLRVLSRALRERGAPAVGVVGMSLGGYTAALFATVDDGVDFCVPMIPLASVAAFMDAHGTIDGTPAQRARLRAAVEHQHAPISPLSRPSRVSPARVRVVAGEYDRITPTRQARLLAEHFACPLLTFPGGHLLQLGRKEPLGEVVTMLRAEGVL